MNKDVLLAGAALAAVFLILLPIMKFFLKPVKLFVRILVQGLIGFILLWIINTFGGLVDFFLPINLVTIVVAGFLGIPGIVLLSVFKYFIIF